MNQSIGVIGVGNPLRQDDGIGLVLLNQMRKKFRSSSANISFVDGGTGGMNLLYLFDRFDVIVLLDAVDFHGKAGETRFFSFDDVRSQKQASTVSTHHADLFQIIKLGKNLDMCTDHIFIFGVQPQRVSFGEDLSEPLTLALNDISNHLFKEVSGIIDSFR